MKLIYLDHNSTTPVLPEVAEAMKDCQASAFGNPSSMHWAGRIARRRLEDARESIAEILGARLGGASGDRLVFTSGGTESNNLAIRGLCLERPGPLVTWHHEHPSVLRTIESLEQQRTVVCPQIKSNGTVDLEELAQSVSQKTSLVACMLGNNETGVLQPIRQAAAACRQFDVPVHTDAVQVVGKYPVDFRGLGVASLSFAAHKFHGPRGIGGLIIRGGTRLQPMLYGGAQQNGIRPGTELAVLAVGMVTALKAWKRDHNANQERLVQLRDGFETQLLSRFPELIIHGKSVQRLPNTSCIGFPWADGQELLLALDTAGIACSLGSACASGSSEPSPSLLAMGVETKLAQRSLRFSVGMVTTEQEVNEAVVRISNSYGRLRREPSAEPVRNLPPRGEIRTL